MILDRIQLTALALACSLATAMAQTNSFQFQLPIAKGPFVGTMNSLTNYTCPEWFRDAKFGIWAHWGPQSVPMEGDWYARKMYQQGDPDYEDHLKRWGHPSTNGWKDIIPLWKAEKWDPDKLMALYKKAGAKYFVSMASHHDNFFLWNSQLHRWNSVQMGPHRDVVSGWQKAAKKYGLPFGVSEHLGASFTWFQTSHGADTNGPLAGVPYDGANSNYWDLYHFPAEPGDRSWYSNNPRWQQEWFNEIEELVDNYKPDLLYTDGGVAFDNEVGLSQIANFYNLSAAEHHGKCMAVYTCKQPSVGRWVHDYERGVNAGIDPHPWQTDTSIGDWFYNKHWGYRPTKWIVHMLVDIVSKNGNLLLNIVQRPDGSLDPEVERMLHQLGDWTAVNGEAIYGTRPWQVYGEGTVRGAGGAFKEDFQYSVKDIRFTTKGKTLYAIALGWPDDGKILIRSLAETDDPAQNKIQKVEMLGRSGKLKFNQTADGLFVEVPGEKLSDLTCALRITGSNLNPTPLPDLSVVVTPDEKGRLVFNADAATLHGTTLQLEEKGGNPDIGYWFNPAEWISWKARIPKPGIYKVSVVIAAVDGGGEFVVGVGDKTLPAKVSQAEGWDKFSTLDIGSVEIKQAGEVVVSVRAKDAASWKAMNLTSVRLEPASAAGSVRIEYSTLQIISNDDSTAVIAEKAAKVLPRANQTDWMRLERTFFLHFGVNTFNEVEWGSGREEPAIFNPTALDANQWLDAMQNFGGKMIVLVCKHHDGFCMWPTRYTPHSVVASPWRDGKGDLVREVANAARAHGLKLGVYLSPADLYQLRTNPKNSAGYYGNGSSNVLSVIPTDPASFKSDPSKGRTPPAGFTNYTYEVDDYNRYFLNQLYELLTEYGPIAEVWFDGANPDPSVKETYNYAAWYDLIRHLQPGAVIMGKGPDVRWVGNEGGVGRTTEWSVIPLPVPPDDFNWPDMQAGDFGSRAKLVPGSYLWWYPAEVNTTILQNNQWFWAHNKQPRTVTQLVDIFYTSIGRNGNLILNLSPDKRGLVPDNQLDALNRTAQIINETFATDLAKGSKVTADNSNATNSPALALDGNLDTWWEAAPGKTTGTVTLTLPKPVTFDVVSLQEAVDHRSQRIESFAIETWNGSAWVAAERIPSDDLTTVGHRRLIRLKSPVTTGKVRIRITSSRLEPTLAEVGLFKQSVKTL